MPNILLRWFNLFYTCFKELDGILTLCKTLQRKLKGEKRTEEKTIYDFKGFRGI